MLAAPRPVLICSATRDFVPIAGTWQAFRQAKRLYTRLDVPERVNLVETDARHGFSRPLREAIVRWMRRWLLQDDSAATDPVREPEFPIHSDRELQCTPQGQVLLMEGTRSLTDVYRAKSRELGDQRARWQQQTPADQQRETIRQVARISSPNEISVPRVEQAGTLRRKGYSIEKLILHPEAGIVLPALLFQPAEPAGVPVLYVHGAGKQIDAGPGGPIEKLVDAGRPVLAVDLRGYGETETMPWRFDEEQAGPNAAEFFIAYLLGRSLVGMRADDVLTSARLLRERTDATAIELVAVDDAGVPALYAAAVAPQLFAAVQLHDVLSSWQEVIDTPVPRDQLENVVHGAFQRYDLPDLIELYGRDRVTIESPRNASREPASAD